MSLLVALLRRFTIRIRMIGAVVMVLGMFAVVGTVGIVAGGHLRALNQEFMEHSIHELEVVTQVRQQMTAIRLGEKQMVIDYEDGLAVLKLREQWARDVAAMRQAIERLLEGDEDEDNALARQAVTHLEAYVKGIETVLQSVQNGAYDNARAADRMLERPKAEIAAVQALVDRISAIVHAEAKATQQSFDNTMRTLLVVFVGVVLMVVGVVVPLTLANSRSITAPIALANELAQAIAGGDLTREIRVEGRDESSELLAALARMQASLARLVGELHASSRQIESASAEVASGNADLSTRTEQAAGSLAHTAGAMLQLTGTVTQTAESARTANQLAAGAAGVAQRGGEVVAAVVTTMDDINTSSRRIADIIATIDGIAFQTNILALNAAVEAARAGEQGRGFAVVAGEVRSLAQRSAAAAREIKALIGASVDKVDAGARLVADAGQTMNEIVASVRQVSQIIAEISSAAAEQSHGLTSVNGSVGELDRVTQQNSALVQQSTAAAESLRNQAHRLTELVATFRVAST